MFSIKIRGGRRLLPIDLELHRSVCVLRPDIATRLFHDEDPVNRSVRIGERTYTVVGVTERLEQGFLSDGSDNNSIFVPYELVASRFWGSETRYWFLVMSFDSIAHVDVALNRITAYLDNTYGRLRGEDRFRVERLDAYIGIVKRVLGIVSTLVLAIAAISLVVGGLGIMNIMLVTVTERTREIGVRMAVGASRADVLSQFVVEAITLCLIGGGAGVLFGIGLAAIACAALQWRLLVTVPIVAAALGASTAIGLVFGIYPAYRASKLQPVDALRSET
jgi:putative ABC transport system permease protein